MRATWHDFSKGLWAVGGKDQTAPGFIRRSKGMHAIRTPSLRSRDGSTILFPLDAHSLFRYNDMRLVGASDTLYFNGAAILVGLDGNRLCFVSMPPQPGLFDYCFVTGGGLLRKVDATGRVSTWGIAEPSGPPSLADGGAGSLEAKTYKYKVVFLNNTTGSRSNGQLVDSSITLGASKQVALTNIPVSTDSQVSAREIYRTLGDGDQYFRAFTISDNTTTATTDNTIDDDLENVALQTDNIAPSASYSWAWAHEGRMWWCRDTESGAQGRAYYSPVGRPESVLGFVEVTNPDDPTQIGFTFNEQNWVMTEKGLYRIAGVDEPFEPRQVFGAPGTIQPRTVTVTPFGVVYQATDGIRLFDGNYSRLVGFVQLGPLFRGRDLEELTAFEGVIGEFARDEYIVSDLTQSLAINLNDQSWRHLGVPIEALYAEKDTKALTASFNFNVYDFEHFGDILDGADAIDIEWELGAQLSDISQRTTVQRIFLDIDTSDQLVTPTLILDEAEIPLPTFLTSAREIVEFSIGRTCRLVAIRLTAACTDVVELYGAEMDLYVPGAEPSPGRG